MILTRPLLIVLLSLLTFASACEQDTKLRIELGNPPKFHMTGSGSLSMFRLHGPKVRERLGESAFIIWEIQPIGGVLKGEGVESLSPIIYGQVPKGYQQIYPEDGSAPPPLVEGQDYDLWIDNTGANGIRTIFFIRDGRVVTKSG